jgi:hypothetical protein
MAHWREQLELMSEPGPGDGRPRARGSLPPAPVAEGHLDPLRDVLGMPPRAMLHELPRRNELFLVEAATLVGPPGGEPCLLMRINLKSALRSGLKGNRVKKRSKG